ncbi:MAG: energy transducer TonB [Candidatus Eremiobacteraeota bacterium]|nr:energy transducer TonB [Candidatus Eremiobacteraeota bacterium]
MTVAILFDGLWQGVIICGIAAILARMLSRESAATRCAVWFSALLAVAVIPVVTVMWPVHLHALDSSVSAGASSRVRITLIALSNAADRSWVVWPVVAVWLCGAVVSMLRLALSAIRIERIRRTALPVIVNDAAILSSPVITTPIAAGVISPVVILPHDLVDKLAPDDVKRVVAHERAHIARNDVLANYVQRIVEAALWFNPSVYAIGHQLVKEREAACDDAAVDATGESHEYAVCLATIAQSIVHPQTPLTSPSVFGSRRALVTRIERLLADSIQRKITFNPYALSAVMAVFVAITLALEAFSPAFAAPVGVGGPATVAAACAPTEAEVTNAPIPRVPHNARPKRPTLLKVTISPDGKIPRIEMAQSSGDWKADSAATSAAEHSTYKPATRNCKAVIGAYIFRVEYGPPT